MLFICGEKMKIIKRVLSIILFMIFFSLIGLTVLNVVGKGSDNPTGFIAPKTTVDVILDDGQIASFWSKIQTYQNVSEFGTKGMVKFSNNGTHLFTLLVSSSNRAWISVEFEPDSSLCMKNLNDGWSFYIDKASETVLAKDILFKGTVIPADDVKNDLQVESIFSDNLVYIELVRPFDTSDVQGYDIIFSNGSTNLLKFASDGNHFGVHEIYFLYIYIPADTPGNETTGNETTGETIIIPADIPDIPLPDVVDLSQVKFLLLGLTPVGVFGFIILHLIRRVLTSPIKHDHERIVSSSWKPPTFVERFKDTFFSEK